ncbi:flexible cuticle protein 12 [Musca vetustissima]|uniref:flexible cuticle protein 12 n=1 Tax=Musca vetustissima TaxID=27455 RepID=UPI002AB6D106|nr:flexible cuticle protein 12 [Musca vetustissima]
MRYFWLTFCIVGVVRSTPIGNTETQQGLIAENENTNTTHKSGIVEIVDSSSSHNVDGSYSFHYRGADGTFREETAVVKNPGTEHQHLEITGAYSFFDADGKEVVVHYTAGDQGFVPEGNNIPEEISAAAKANSEIPASTTIVEEPKSSDDSEEDDMFRETAQINMVH